MGIQTQIIEKLPSFDNGSRISVSAEIGISYAQRPRVHGKFIYVGDVKFWVRGVTYGTFRPGEDGTEYPDPEIVDRDFASIAANGMNAVRIYTVPPRWLLNLAQRHGLRVMVGLPWEQHIAFLDDKKRAKAIEDRVREAVKSCAQHPAILCYSVGNEIPSPIVRLYGRRRVERFIKRLYQVAKSQDPEGLVTYVNFPTTEYLQLSFLDLVCFNVFLESREGFEAYLARLQNIAGERPLLMTEIGLDSRRNGQKAQALSLEWQVRAAFASGCAGAFVFTWTDEWHRGGFDIEDWDFGLTTRDRCPKPALATVRKAFAEVPFPKDMPWPGISVVVCSCNGSHTIRDCFEGLQKLEYPKFEVLVINDGSTDATAYIAQEYGFRVISTENRGLGSARNTGMEAATGEIIAYIDDDAYPDPHWLCYLAATFLNTTHAAVGGPNIAPPGDGSIADCVANAPGGPVHVLMSDREAEHIPGCNMAFRKSVLEAIGGFDPQFRSAGDDVDVCWRVQQRGWTLGFNPAAMVWHHRRNSVKAYWKQQKGYGKAEALLEKKWLGKYNTAGHLTWAGRIYGKGLTHPVIRGRWRVYQGIWGTALFQSLYQSEPKTLFSLPLMPEWYFLIAFLAALSLIGTLWHPLLVSVPLFITALAAPVIQSVLSAKPASFTTQPCSAFKDIKKRAVTALLHLLQPLARLLGRLRCGLAPWRSRGASGFVFPWRRTFTLWSETWRAPVTWLETIEHSLNEMKVRVRKSGDFDSWDLEVRGGIFGSARILMAIEEHGAGRQLVRFRAWPQCHFGGIVLFLLFFLLSFGAATDHAWAACIILGIMTLLLPLRMFQECALAMGALHDAIQREKGFNGCK